MFRGLASTVSLSAESGKSEKGQPPNLKKQSPPKSKILVVVIREREHKTNKAGSFPRMKRSLTTYLIYGSSFPAVSRL